MVKRRGLGMGMESLIPTGSKEKENDNKASSSKAKKSDASDKNEFLPGQSSSEMICAPVPTFLPPDN